MYLRLAALRNHLHHPESNQALILPWNVNIFLAYALYQLAGQIEDRIFVRLDRLGGIHNKCQWRIQNATPAHVST